VKKDKTTAKIKSKPVGSKKKRKRKTGDEKGMELILKLMRIGVPISF